MAGRNFEEILQHLLAICVCKACLSGLECLQVNWKGRKTGVITQLSGKGTVES